MDEKYSESEPDVSIHPSKIVSMVRGNQVSIELPDSSDGTELTFTIDGMSRFWAHSMMGAYEMNKDE